MATETYVDTMLLITAMGVREGPAFQNAMEILDDGNRTFVCSDYLKLECMPKKIFYGVTDDIEFLEIFFGKARSIPSSPAITEHALSLASKHDIGGFDALHLSSAAAGRAVEFVSAEHPSKPIFRATELGLRLTSIYIDGA